MRFVAIALVILAWPALIAWIRSNPGKRHWAYFGIGLLPFTLNSWNLDASWITWPAWPGYAKGLVTTLLDSLALAIIFTHRTPKGLPPFAGYLIAYILAAMLSVAMSEVPMASTFYAFQLLRMLILVIAVAKLSANPKALQWIAYGLAAGIAYQAGFTIWQKLNGAFQAAGTMGHQNLLGLMTHFVTLPLLAMLLSGARGKIIMVGVVSGLIVVALGASRGAIGFGIGGIVLLILLSLIRRSTPQKWRIVGFAAVTLVLTAPLLTSAINNRLGQIAASRSRADERAQFETAAKAMIADHPMGIGANQYVVVANSKGYSARAGVSWNWASRSANVHNTYLLVAAETGWVGLITFFVMLFSVILAGLRFAFQDRRDPRGEIVLGCTVAVIAVAAHNLYEWVFVTYQAQYLFSISIGVIAGMVRARAMETRIKRRPATGQIIPFTPPVAVGSPI